MTRSIIPAALATAAFLQAGAQTRPQPTAPMRTPPPGSLRSDRSRATTSRSCSAWEFHTRELAGGEGPNPKRQVAAFQTRPVFVDGSLYLTTTSRVLALDADTGKQQWVFDPQADRPRRCEQPHRGRGGEDTGDRGAGGREGPARGPGAGAGGQPGGQGPGRGPGGRGPEARGPGEGEGRGRRAGGRGARTIFPARVTAGCSRSMRRPVSHGRSSERAAVSI